MKVQHTLTCLLFLSLQGGNRGLVSAQIIVYSGTEGGDVTVQCSPSRSGSSMFFCRAGCKEKDILVETTGAIAHRDRYSIQYRASGGRAAVTVKQLRKSDSGLYRCGFDSRLSNEQIEIIVIDAALHDESPSGEKTLYAQTGGSVVVECALTGFTSRMYFCRNECGPNDVLAETSGARVRRGRYSAEYVEASPLEGFLFVSITLLNESDSGRYRCAVRRSSSRRSLDFTVVVTDGSTASAPAAATAQTLSSDQQQPEMTPAAAADIGLYVGLTLVVLLVLLSLAVLIYCRKISAKPEEPPEEPEYASVSQTNRVYEDVRGDRQVRSPEAEDDSSKLTYSELSFSNPTHDSALCGNDDNVVYAVPRLKASSDSGRAKEDPPLYSAVT